MAAGDASAFGRKNVAYRVTFPIFDADGDLVSGATGLDSEVSKDGGTFTDATNEATEIATSSGIYYLDLTATEMNADTVAVLIKTSSSGAKTTALVIYPLKDGDIVANMTQVAGQTASAAGAVTFPGTIASTTNITAGTITTATNVTNAVTVGTNNDKTGYSIGTAGITSSSFAAGAIDAAAMNVNGSEFTAIPWNPAWDAEVRTEVQGAIETNHLDHLLAVAYDPASPVGVADSLLNDLVEDNGAGTTRFTTTALEQAPAGGGGGGTDWTTDERTQIRQILGVATSGTTPTDPTTGILDTIRDLVVTVDTVADRIEVDTQDIQGRLPAALVSGRIDASVGAMASGVLTAAALATDAVGEIADGVWDEAYGGHTTAGSFGKLMDTLRKANYITEGAVAAGGTPTTTVFRTNLTEPTGTFDNQTLLFITGTLAGESKPVQAYSATNGQITLGDALTATPTAADEFVILPDHVHPLGEIATAVYTGQMSESYRAAGVAPTLAQTLFELIAQMGDSAISGTTKTLKKIDGTTAKTFTLDSATTPTSITEAT
jgi:hypothetical protein